MKTLVHKITGEFVHIISGECFTGEFPQILGDCVTKQDIIDYSARFFNKDLSNQFEDYDLREITISVNKPDPGLIG